jgi:hypothetical protein
MVNEIELVSDGDGLVVLGASADVERFLLSTGLDRTPKRGINVGCVPLSGVVSRP